MRVACSGQSNRGRGGLAWQVGRQDGAGGGNRKTCHWTIGAVADGAVSGVGGVTDYGS